VLIALGNATVARYPPGGGHWSWFLQYPLGLRALGHDVFWLELLPSTGSRQRDLELVRIFFERIAAYGLAEDCTLALLQDRYVQDLGGAEIFGAGMRRLDDAARSADLLWNLSCSIRSPLLSRFRRTVLVDTDPGHLQVARLGFDLEIEGHDVLLTVGAKMNDADCTVPKLGLEWRTFMPFVHLPMWECAPDPGPAAPFTSITQWTWEELAFGDRMVSVGKRAGYLPYVDLPRLVGRPCELAVNIGPVDPAGDRERFAAGGWTLADPHEIVSTPESYRDYIRRSRGEILCSKPIYRELRTGWFSDRSVCYLASGRPVVAEETGFSERIPTGRGLLAFKDPAGAAESIRAIDADYAGHSRAARELACEMFDARRCLTAMIEACE
jgi:hypothetical protein